jgi:hypothetical protein
MSAVGMTAKNVTVRSLTRCSPRSSSSRPPSRASGAATPTGPGTTFRLLGVPVRVSTQVPGAQAGGELILADMNQVALGRDTAPSLRPLRPALPSGGGQVRHQAAERRRHLQHHHRVMAEHKGVKAPEKTAEGLRRVNVVLYDTDPDQLACIACGQQWRATSLRGRWWQCPNRCNQSAAYQRTGHLPVTDRVDRATTPGRLPLAPGRGRDQAGGAAHSQGDRQPGWLPRAFAPYGTSPARRGATGCQPLLQRTAACQAGRRWRPAGRPLPSRGRCRFRA